MQLQPDQQRVVTEKADLDEKVAKLERMVGVSPVFKEMSSIDKVILIYQLDCMRNYQNALEWRISVFPA